MADSWRSVCEFTGYTREEKLAGAFQRVFQGSPSPEDQQMVMCHLASHSGFQQVLPPSATDAELRYREGQRALFGLIFAYLTLAPSDIEAFSVAARREAAMSQI